MISQSLANLAPNPHLTNLHESLMKDSWKQELLQSQGNLQNFLQAKQQNNTNKNEGKASLYFRK